MGGGRAADLRGFQAGDDEGVGGLCGDACAGEEFAEAVRFRGDDLDRGAAGGADEFVDRGVGEEAALADDDQMVGGERHLAHEVGGDEDGAAFGGQGLEEGADPEHALGVEAVDGFVEDDGGGVAEERGGDAEALAHAEEKPLTRLRATWVRPVRARTRSTRVWGMPWVWARTMRWWYAERPGCSERASRRAPTRVSGARWAA